MNSTPPGTPPVTHTNAMRSIGMDGSVSTNTSATIANITDLSLPNRKIWVVTTAALPWRTGTSVNPLARALYLTRGRPAESVTLLIPWLSNADDQTKLFGAENVFSTRQEQEDWIRQYAKERVQCKGNERMEFYVGTPLGWPTFAPIPDNLTSSLFSFCHATCFHYIEESAKLRIRFYSAVYNELMGSILATEDICGLVPADEADVAILEGMYL